MILDITVFPAPSLFNVSLPVKEFDETLTEFVNSMKETMYDYSGVGLAAPQVGVNKQILVYDISSTNNELKVLINPQLAYTDGEYFSEGEGCLSLPGLKVNMVRANSIIVDAVDLFGNSIKVEAEGFEAAVIQHEIDHLNGELLINNISRIKRQLYGNKLKKFKREIRRGNL